MANKRRGNNEGTIYQRESGSWRAQVSIDGERLSKTFETQNKCKVWRDKMIRKIDRGLTYRDAQTSLKEFMNDWLIMKETSIKTKTLRQYTQIANDYIYPNLGEIKLINLRPDQIQALYTRLVSTGDKLRTYELTHAVLRGCLNHAVKLGVINRNPTQATTPPKPKKKEKLVFDENQIQTFLIAAKSKQPDYYPIYHLALTTGMRVNELLGLKWEDINWSQQTLSVKRQLKRDPESGFWFDQPKTEAGKRTLLLGKESMRILQSLNKQSLDPSQQILEDNDFKDLIFSEEDGTPMRYRKLYRNFKNLIGATNLPDLTFHDLRHTNATQMLAKGIDLQTVSKRLGHSKLSTTLDNYIHAIPGFQDKAAQLMDEITTPVAIEIRKTAPKLHRE